MNSPCNRQEAGRQHRALIAAARADLADANDALADAWEASMLDDALEWQYNAQRRLDALLGRGNDR